MNIYVLFEYQGKYFQHFIVRFSVTVLIRPMQFSSVLISWIFSWVSVKILGWTTWHADVWSFSVYENDTLIWLDLIHYRARTQQSVVASQNCFWKKNVKMRIYEEVTSWGQYKFSPIPSNFFIFLTEFYFLLMFVITILWHCLFPNHQRKIKLQIFLNLRWGYALINPL